MEAKLRNPSSVLVTGGAGFIGSALVRFLVQRTDCRVVVLDKLTYAANLASLAPVETSRRFRFVQADVCDRPALDALFAEERFDLVVHLAAETHVDRSIAGAAPFLETNIVGTYQLLEAALEFWRRAPNKLRERFLFVHVSTDEVYGSLDAGGHFTEEHPYRPNSPYAASKASADLLVRAWHRTYGLPAVITNSSNNYGPYQFPEKLIPLTILNALEGKPLAVYGTGQNVRDWVHVEDHVRALWRIAEAGEVGESYNVGANAERSNLEVVRLLCGLLDRLAPGDHEGGYASLITFVEDRPGHDLRYAIDAAKLSNTLGWAPEESLEQGLEDTVRWYLGNENWWRPIREGSYAGQRLGLLADRVRAG